MKSTVWKIDKVGDEFYQVVDKIDQVADEINQVADRFVISLVSGVALLCNNCTN